MVLAGWLAAAGETTTDPGVAKVERIARIVGYVIAGYFGILFAGLAVLLVFCGVMYIVLRVNGPDSPFTRRVVARLEHQLAGVDHSAVISGVTLSSLVAQYVSRLPSIRFCAAKAASP